MTQSSEDSNNEMEAPQPNWKEAVSRAEAEEEKLQREFKIISRQIQRYDERIFYLEADRMRERGRLWGLVVVMLFAFRTYAMVFRGFIPALLLDVALLLCWRLVYLPKADARGPLSFAVAMIAMVLYLG